MSVTINLGQAIHALSDALDLVGVDEVFHGKRVAVMAWQCGRGLGMSEQETGGFVSRRTAARLLRFRPRISIVA
jgi:hypothetical protein